MKNRNFTNNYTHFFVEIVLSILMLSIVATVIMNIYSITNKKMTLSDYKDKAANCSSQFINTYKITNDVDCSIKSAFGEGTYNINGEYITVNLNTEFDIDEEYKIEVVIHIYNCDEADNIDNIDISYLQYVFDEEKKLFDISASAIKEDAYEK